VKHAVPPSQYTMTLPADYGPPVGPVPDPPTDDPVAYGTYLAGPIAVCLGCHTPRGPSGSLFDPTRLFAGGREFRAENWTMTYQSGGVPSLTKVIYSANLTPDLETGIGRWSDAQIRQAITQGTRPDGRLLHPLMRRAGGYAEITPSDLTALIAYLRSLPPVVNKIPPP